MVKIAFSSRSFHDRILGAGIWVLVGFAAQKLLQLASSLILTRILFPEAFGLMALVNVFMVGLDMFSDVGINPAIIQNKRGEAPVFLNTAWTIQIARGFLLWGAACVLAWPAAQMYQQPLLLPLLCFVGVTAAVNGFQTTALATRNRNLLLGKITLVQFIGQLSGFLGMLTMAWVLESVWGLAIGTVIGSLVEVILGHVLLDSHRHRFHIDAQSLQEIIRFGKWIFLSTLFTYLGGEGLKIIQGLLVSMGTLGILTIANTLSWAVGDLVSKVLGSVGFPVLSKVARDDPLQFPVTLARFQRRMLMLTIPVFLLLSFLSSTIIDVLYDERYAAAGEYLRIMAINGAVATLPMYYQNAFLSVGDSRQHFVFIGLSMILRILGMLTGFYLADVIGMLLGLGTGTLLVYCYVIFVTHQKGWASLRVDALAIGLILVGMVISYHWLMAA